VDLFADENGRAVHEACYVGGLRRARTAAALEELFTAPRIESPNLHCPQCGLALSQASATFFLENGKSWNVPLPVCTYCNLNDSHVALYVDV
jgi:hypothetical protein